MADDTTTCPPPPTASAAWVKLRAFLGGLSLSRIQAMVATLAGLASITGVTLTAMQFVRATNNTGQLVAIVQAAGSHRAVADATVEVLTAQNALVATLRPDAGGRVAQELREGVYVVRVSHPRYAVDVRRIAVQPRQTIELRTNLRAGSSSPVTLQRSVSKGISAVRRALGF